ncbi:MAG: molybdopterin-dependent oxidoreductase [Deltaproteobacteria bacterium]|nr:molybdopterin-dependent oxidoreductase [Deltaproteobacteria bacterium]
MNEKQVDKEIRGYCSQCSGICRTVAHVRDGKFIKVQADNEHPLSTPLCPKAIAGPELVYNSQRLKHPMRRTRPKGDPDPGWERISWDEALDTIAERLNKIKEESGVQAIATACAGPSGSPFNEMWQWLLRFSNGFGTINSINTTHICQYHRDNLSAYTYGKPGTMLTAGRPQYENSGCILIWGNNIHETRSMLLPLIKKGIKNGAKLIVVDPRKIKIAEMADLHLQVKPGSDGALALGMLHVMIEEKLYDHDFTRDWTTAPFLVRSDTEDLLRADSLSAGADPKDYVIMNSESEKPGTFKPGTPLSFKPALDTSCTVKLIDGTEVECKTVFRLLRESLSDYSPARVENLTRVPEETIRDATRMLISNGPASWFSWNGIEKSINATQTNRALCILYALTGDYDKKGGNVITPFIPTRPIMGFEFADFKMKNKRLGRDDRPLGPMSSRACDIYEAILTEKPYPIKAILGFGGNFLMSHPPVIRGREALTKLDFHVECELFLSPTAELADIVLPAASSWESWHAGIMVSSQGDKAYVQARPPVVPPQHESWPDLKIMFELAKRLGFGDKFWDGDIDAGWNQMFAPSGITVEKLKHNPGGIEIDLNMEYQKYGNKDDDGNYVGFETPSKRVEIYSQIFKDNGYDPLPTWEDTIISRGREQGYDLSLIGSKLIEFSHSQHRSMPTVRKRVPHPFLEINPKKAGELGVSDGDWVIVESAHGSITLQAKLTDAIQYDVVCTQNGWWQGCPELDLPGYDPFSPDGANENMLHGYEESDPVSGCLQMKGFPCKVRKK